MSINQTKKILRSLVAIDSTSALSNEPLSKWIVDYCSPFSNVEVTHIGNGYDPKDQAPGVYKENLLIHLGPDIKEGGIMLSGHMDCVPANAQEWTTPPLNLTEKNGALFGRGATDMKGFNACVLSMLPKWSKMNLKKPIYVALSYDEEVGRMGVTSLLEIIKKRGINPDLCIVGEATEMNVAKAHNMRADVKFVCTATGGHPSTINDSDITCASTLSAYMITHLDKNIGKITQAFNKEAPSDFLTIGITGIETPITHNQIATKTIVHGDFRGHPDLTEKKILDVFSKESKAVVKKYKNQKIGAATIEVDATLTNSGFLCQDSNALKLASALAGNPEKAPIAVGYVCEAANFSEAGIKTVICGPGSARQAHAINEFVKISQLEECLEMLNRVGNFCKVPKPSALAL